MSLKPVVCGRHHVIVVDNSVISLAVLTTGRVWCKPWHKHSSRINRSQGDKKQECCKKLPPSQKKKKS